MNIICNKCEQFGFTFKAEHLNSPKEFWEGPKDAKILIVGLNPKNDPNRVEERTINEMEFLDPESHPYFRDLKNVSKNLYDNWSSDSSIVAHTDLVKCSSYHFPPKINDITLNKKSVQLIINSCSSYLIEQIKRSNVEMIICNGAPVSKMIRSIFPPQNNDHITSYNYQLHDRNIKIILSGFIGRIDNHNRRRLGQEIESFIEL